MSATAPSLDNLAEKTMGGCRLIRRIGKGAMGVVYLAEQLTLKRQVAFKILDPKFSCDPSYIERFEMEARAAAQLSHPNIVKVYDFGSENGLHYIVNEYVEGGTIQDRIEEHGSLPPEKSVEYAIQVASGLVVAYQANIIHRDIKPENLMIASDGTLKIADFGLAKTMTPETPPTDCGLIMGTPFYMSPEQAKGLHMDSRSDIYSLGVSLYCMVIGDVPFDADSVVGVLLKQISAERPDPCAVKPELPSVLGSLIMRMMDRLPENRPANPEELLRELEAVRDILRPSAPPSLAGAAVPAGRRQNFMPLPSSRITRISRMEAAPDVLARIIRSIQNDSGFAVESAAPYPVNTVVEVRFVDPGKNAEMSGLGLVRWADVRCMGVTFVKVQPIPQSTADSVRLSGPLALAALTASPLHQRLLRLVYANAGQIMSLSKIASGLGVGVKMAEDPIRTFERAGMMQVRPDGQAELKWPQDEALQREIVLWIERHGLR